MLSAPVFYIRSPFLPGPPEIDSDFVDFLLAEPDDALARVANQLESYVGYLAAADRHELLTRLLDDPEKVLDYEAALDIGEEYQGRHGGLDGIIKSVGKGLRSASGDERAPLAPDDVAVLRRRIEIILRPYPSRHRQIKAERLSLATGLGVETIELVCDLRPVFDEGRTRIEGLMPLTTLKVVASGVDKFPVSFEAILSVKDVESLLENVKAVVAKLNVLGTFADAAGIPIPTVELTRTGD